MTNLVKTNLARPATWLAGCIADLPTPFDDNDRIDSTAFAGLCERQIEAGASAIVVGETAGDPDAGRTRRHHRRSGVEFNRPGHRMDPARRNGGRRCGAFSRALL